MWPRQNEFRSENGAFGEVLPCHHQELVNLRVFQLVVGVPKLGLELLLNPGVRFSWGEKPWKCTILFSSRIFWFCSAHLPPVCRESRPDIWNPLGSRPGLPAESFVLGQTPASKKSSPGTRNHKKITTDFITASLLNTFCLTSLSR